MKKPAVFILGFLSLTLAMMPSGQDPQTSFSSLAATMPTGPLLFVESPDFATLLHDWENSQEKQKWLASDNYRVFSRSRLFLRLQEAQRQFAVAAGVPADMAVVDSVAGGPSALALYDIGNLEFLYVTRIPSARAMQNVLWANREKFEPRKAADIPYWVRTEPEKNRLVAFATSGDYLLLATREDLMAGALALLSGKSQPNLQDETWFKNAVSATGPAGDLRMVLNVPLLVKSPHFRTYWIQRNVTALKQYSAEVADIHRSATEIREDRVLLKAAPPAEAKPRAAGSDGLAELLAMVPAQEDLYRAWTAPSADTVLDLVQQKVLAPHPALGVASQIAPAVGLTPGQPGRESDLETRIDIPPLQETASPPGAEALQKLLHAAPLEAVLEFHALHNIGESAFIEPESAILICGSANWDSDAARHALRAAIADLWTTSQIGVNWVEHHEGSADYYQLDGLVPLTVAAQGKILLMANSVDILKSLLTHSQAAGAGQNVIYAAGFRHFAEREKLVKMMRLIEIPLAQMYGGIQGEQGRTPFFFSENLASLSQSLESIQSETLVVEDRGAQLQQTVTYQLKK